jgi:hypothetical protein
VAVDLSEAKCCSKEGFMFVITPRQGLGELVTVILLSGVYGALMAYFLHSYTFVQVAKEGDIDIVSLILIAIVVLFSSYSLFSKPIPESTPYLTSDSFSIFSQHYQRLYYSCIIAIIAIIIEASSSHPHKT